MTMNGNDDIEMVKNIDCNWTKREKKRIIIKKKYERINIEWWKTIIT